MNYIRTKYGIYELKKTGNCLFAIRDTSKESENCYVSYMWDNWKEFFLIDEENCMFFSYNSAQSFIGDLLKENIDGAGNLKIELHPYYRDCKQADTPEELCDEFVVVTPKSDKFIARKKMVDGKEYLLIDKTGEVIELKNIKDYLVDLYGAIWVIDVNGVPTLKPVAKMNEKRVNRYDVITF